LLYLVLNSLGLLFDIAGVVLLFKYGLPEVYAAQAPASS
jgi:hypothetical protein